VTVLSFNREVSTDELRTAFRTVDPDIDDWTLDTYIGLACQVRGEQPDQGAVLVETALERILAGDVKQVGPSPTEGSTTHSDGEQGDFQH